MSRQPSRRAWLVAVVLIATSVAPSASAQTGRIQGFVRDETGKPIRSATVVAENPDATPPSFTATTDERGRWSMIGLRAGTWTFKASAQGFQTATGSGRVETIGQNPNLEFRLAKGDRVPGPNALAGVDIRAVQNDLTAADALLADAKYDQAISAYRAVLTKAPALTSVRLRISQAQRYKRDYDGALATLRDIPPTDPIAPDALKEAGLTYLEKGDLAQADLVLARAAASPGASRDVFYALGDVKLARGDTDEAVRWYERAAETDAKWAKPLLKLGVLAANRGDGVAARKYLEQVMALAPGSPEATQARTILDQVRD